MQKYHPKAVFRGNVLYRVMEAEESVMEWTI